MKFRFLRIYSYLFWVVVGHAFPAEVTFHHFIRDPTLDDYISPTVYIHKQYVTKLISCGSLCGGKIGCTGFFFTKQHKTCQLQAAVIKPEKIDTLQNSSGTVYYFLKNYDSHNVFFECPVNNGYWTAARLSDGSSFIFKLFTDNSVSQLEAVTSCCSVGGTLLKILTEEKMNFVLNNLTKCADVKDKSYWIDGSNTDASDRFAADAYQTVDDETVAQNLSFWYPGMPDQPYWSNCIWISPDYSYYMDDVYCNHNSNAEVHYICERQIN